MPQPPTPNEQRELLVVGVFMVVMLIFMVWGQVSLRKQMREAKKSSRWMTWADMDDGSDSSQ
ncbi:MAG TPA: hypothetical protein VHN77_07875 [Phycisphaerales bacterium]|nr:hypothetical protein [Phycisphaerales bacterium]